MSHPGVETEDRSAAGRIWGTVGGSILLKLAVFGVVLILMGVVLDTSLAASILPNSGLWAAILPLWGVALLALGVSFYSLIWWSHQ